MTIDDLKKALKEEMKTIDNTLQCLYTIGDDIRRCDGNLEHIKQTIIMLIAYRAGILNSMNFIENTEVLDTL